MFGFCICQLTPKCFGCTCVTFLSISPQAWKVEHNYNTIGNGRVQRGVKEEDISLLLLGAGGLMKMLDVVRLKKRQQNTADKLKLCAYLYGFPAGLGSTSDKAPPTHSYWAQRPVISGVGGLVWLRMHTVEFSLVGLPWKNLRVALRMGGEGQMPNRHAPCDNNFPLVQLLQSWFLNEC